MKTLIPRTLFAIVLCALATSQVHAQLVLKPSKLVKKETNAKTESEMIKQFPSKAEKDRATGPTTSSTIKTRVGNKNRLFGGPGIQKFEASRVGDGIMISATVSNTADQSASFYFKLSRQIGNRWSTIHEGSRLIGPKDQVSSVFTLPRSNDALKLRFEIDGGNDDAAFSKEFRLKALPMSFIVRYGTSGDWVPAREYFDDLSNGFDASEFARLNLRTHGLDTKIRKKTSTVVDDPFSIQTKLFTTLFVRTDGMLNKTFETRAEAESFRRTLISLVKDRRLTVESVREKPL
jgi:hypothetical protein